MPRASLKDVTMAVSSHFNPGNGALTTTGDNLDNTIMASRDATGSILINAGAVPIQGGQPRSPMPA